MWLIRSINVVHIFYEKSVVPEVTRTGHSGKVKGFQVFLCKVLLTRLFFHKAKTKPFPEVTCTGHTTAMSGWWEVILVK